MILQRIGSLNVESNLNRFQRRLESPHLPPDLSFQRRLEPPIVFSFITASPRIVNEEGLLVM
jgi:hypothetical protein